MSASTFKAVYGFLAIFDRKLDVAMTTDQLKQDIHQLVERVHNAGTLIDLHTAVALIIEQQDMPLDDDDPVLRERVNKVMEQVELGEYITNEAMKQQVNQWLAK